jgi:XTP/dITP diphosphohydrolase
MTSHRLVLATRNAGKIEEFRRILERIAPGAIDLIGVDQFPEIGDVDETEDSFAGNALLKARTIAEKTGIPAIADDSGLCVDALGGSPGIFSARWAGVHGDDVANVEKVLGQLRDIPAGERGAHFTCVSALALPGGTEITEEGSLEGDILMSPIGSHGFGYDPIFRPSGFDLSLAQLGPEIKDAISHRGQSLRAIAPRVAQLLDGLR